MSAYRLRPGVPLAAEVRRIASEQVNHCLEDLGSADRHEAAHEVRKRCKKVRALLRLIRDGDEDLYRTENALFRDLAWLLSGDRDRAAIVEAFEAVVDAYVTSGDGRETDAGTVQDGELHPATAAAIRRGLLRQRARDTAPWEEQRAAVRAELTAAQARIGGWPVPGQGFEALADGLHRTYRRARRRMDDAYAEGTPAAFHEWRKRTKYHWHHLQLLRDAWRPVLRAQAREVHELSEILGHERDLGVLLATLRDAPHDHGGVEVVARFGALVERRRGDLLAEARERGRRCFGEPPRNLVDRLEAYWAVAARTG